MILKYWKSATDKIQHVLIIAVHFVSGTQKFDLGLMHLLHSELTGSTFRGSALTPLVGHLTRKIVPDMTYNVFGETMNPDLSRSKQSNHDVVS